LRSLVVLVGNDNVFTISSEHSSGSHLSDNVEWSISKETVVLVHSVSDFLGLTNLLDSTSTEVLNLPLLVLTIVSCPWCNTLVLRISCAHDIQDHTCWVNKIFSLHGEALSVESLCCKSSAHVLSTPQGYWTLELVWRSKMLVLGEFLFECHGLAIEYPNLRLVSIISCSNDSSAVSN
jgi:hypothetical protein